MTDYETHYERTAWQYDPKTQKVEPLRFYIKSKIGKCKKIENDKIFIIGIENQTTKHFEEFACSENEWFMVIELLCKNDLRLDAQKRYINRLQKLIDELLECGAKAQLI